MLPVQLDRRTVTAPPWFYFAGRVRNEAGETGSAKHHGIRIVEAYGLAKLSMARGNESRPCSGKEKHPLHQTALPHFFGDARFAVSQFFEHISEEIRQPAFSAVNRSALHPCRREHGDNLPVRAIEADGIVAKASIAGFA